VALLGAGLAVLELDNALSFHTLSLDGPPPTRIHFCGRDYDAGPPSSNAPSPGPLTSRPAVIAIAPSGTAIYADEACSHGVLPGGLYAQAGPSEWIYYGLSGGP